MALSAGQITIAGRPVYHTDSFILELCYCSAAHCCIVPLQLSFKANTSVYQNMYIIYTLQCIRHILIMIARSF